MRKRPYGANEAMDKWVEQYGWKYSPRASCLHWISKGRCNHGCCCENVNTYKWMDHTSGWTKDGVRLLLCQPYGISEPDTLVQACKEIGLAAAVHGSGWYGHGTVAIELRKM